ncbi:MAG: TatD family hydrolase [bacterium]|nr:TatD family hydrolase [bacterium]
MKYFDSHCHLQLSQFDADRGAVLARMEEREVGGIVVGTDFETSKAAVELAQQHDFLWASVGLHPNDNKDEDFYISKYEELARDPKVVAIGECGLDYFRSTGEGQKEKFEAQIELARKLNKALIIHCRDAHDDCSSILQKTRIPNKVPVVIHFFTGSAELAQKYLELGCYLSFPGPITYTDMYDDSIRLCLLDKMLVETDSPFAAPMPHRGKRNEPSYVEYVVAKVADIKGISPEEAGRQITLNSQRVFGLQ